MFQRAVTVAVLAMTLVCATNAQVEEIREVNNLNFGQLIGNPLTAVVQAQAQAAAQTIQFVLEVGFQQPEGEGNPIVNMLSYSFAGFDEDGNDRSGQIEVPLLSVIPIPYVQFESVDVEFNAKISSQTKQQSSNTGAFDFSASSGNNHYNSNCHYSARSRSSYKGEINRELNLRVAVHARQGDQPEGMRRILDKLMEMIYSIEE